MRFAVERSESEAIAADYATLDAKAKHFSESIKVISCNVTLGLVLPGLSELFDSSRS
jgi:hypothetical protein